MTAEGKDAAEKWSRQFIAERKRENKTKDNDRSN